ncbi:cyclase family protein [Cumulibacter manganitolerans]|uniref:cyclase family protein n=1 Tax=Cumulibacter manganitolerans TaxID=1884992 RepID=UPI0012962FE0|nr:cyclase family protein [Cumulibacter manganitolerans]
MTQIPSYDELPEGPNGGRLGWHIFGADDQLGLINLLTEERVAEATALVKRGAAFPLEHAYANYDPAPNTKRGNPKHNLLVTRNDLACDDFYDAFFPQGGSQWDSLAHVAYDLGTFYNGATIDQIRAAERNMIINWSRHGIAGRAVVLDIPATMEKQGKSYDAGTNTKITVEDLKAAVEHAGLEHRTGDIVVLYTGFEQWYAGLDQAARDDLPNDLVSPGIENSEDMARYLWDIHCAAVVSDNYSVESWPATFGEGTAPFGFLHQMLIGSFGMALGELWHLSDLVADCRETGVYEGMLVSSPMMAPRGVGSTANAVVLK